jgi:hypothetical protein
MDRSKTRENLLEIKALVDRCLADLDSAKPRRGVKSSKNAHSVSTTKVDLDVPLRAFVKKYAKGMSGPKKFALLLARLARGDLKAEIALSEIERSWNKMRAASLMGMKFNRFYPVQAKTNDWVDSGRKGFYRLRPSWREIFGEKRSTN